MIQFPNRHGKMTIDGLTYKVLVGDVVLLDGQTMPSCEIVENGVDKRAPIYCDHEFEESEMSMVLFEPAGTRPNPPTGYAGIIIRNGQIEIKSSKGSIIRATFYGNPYAPFDDAPVRGRLAFWGPVLTGIVGGIAMVGVALVFGTAGFLLAPLVLGGLAFGGLNLIAKGVGDLLTGDVDSIEEYGRTFGNGLLTGAALTCVPLAGIALMPRVGAAITRMPGAKNLLVAGKPVANKLSMAVKPTFETLKSIGGKIDFNKLVVSGFLISNINYVNDVVYDDTGENLVLDQIFDGNAEHYNAYLKLALLIGLNPVGAKDVVVKGISLKPALRYKTMRGMEVEFTNPSGNTVKYVEQTPKDMDAIINANLSSGKEGRVLEGKIAQIVKESGTLEATGLKIETLSKQPISDIDILASSGANRYIIEVKNSVGAIDKRQLDKQINPNGEGFFNHEGREIIYYISDPIPNGKKEIEKLKLLEDNNIKIFSSREELRGLFEL